MFERPRPSWTYMRFDRAHWSTQTIWHVLFGSPYYTSAENHILYSPLWNEGEENV